MKLDRCVGTRNGEVNKNLLLVTNNFLCFGPSFNLRRACLKRGVKFARIIKHPRAHSNRRKIARFNVYVISSRATVRPWNLV